MILKLFDASEAAKLGVALADQYAPPRMANSATLTEQSPGVGRGGELIDILQRADGEVRSLRLNFYKKAKFANSFKWRLLENGVAQNRADEITQQLIVHLSRDAMPAPTADSAPNRASPSSERELLARGNKCMARGAYAEAIGFYEALIKIDPRHHVAYNNLGSALSKLGRAKEAEGHFYQSIRIEPNFTDALSNVGTTLVLQGRYSEAEDYFRHALRLNPRFVDARVNLGLTLAFWNRLRDAKSQLEKALKYEPRNAEALFGMALVAKTEGAFDKASALLGRALQINPRMSKALASQAGLRKMTASDGTWLANAEAVAASGIIPLDESELRFAIGKYYDDTENFKFAFQNYKRANDLLKPLAKPLDREAHRQFADSLIQAYTPAAVAHPGHGGSPSEKPVFVVGMPRSGTSLTEQIISSHPSAKGAGELEFWSQAVHAYQSAINEGVLDESTRNKLAEDYLRILEAKSGDALRIVDKAPVNSDYLGVIHSIFPNARIIYMRRDPLDTCLSCYFQKFVLSMNYTMDLSDLAYYYRQHERLMSHWRKVLPPGTILEIPYEGLVSDQERWTREILDFLGLEWDARCLDFHKTERTVATASFWQVRQKMYDSSVRRWRHYEKFIGPLLDLKQFTR